MRTTQNEAEVIDAFQTDILGRGEVSRLPAGARNMAFHEIDETQLAKQLLEITDQNELDRFVGALIVRTTGRTIQFAWVPELTRILRQAAQRALPALRATAENPMASEVGGVETTLMATAVGDVLRPELEGLISENSDLQAARRFVRFAITSAKHARSFQASASGPLTIAARRGVGAAVLQELYQSPRQLNEGLLSFEYPLFIAGDEELDYFLGKLIRGASKAVRGVAKTVGKGLSAIDKVVPVSMLSKGLSMTPLGMAVRAGVGALQAAGQGRNVFQGALRSIAVDPGTRFLVDTGLAAARGENIAKAAQKAFRAGIADVRKSMQFAAMVAPFIPGIGTGVAAALGAANALASGQPISDAVIAAARSAVPGGAIAQMAFDTAVNLAKGKNVGEALLNSARARLPGGPAAQAAFDAAVTLAKGKSIQDAALAATGRLLPRSPYAADALAFVRKVAAGQNIQRAALSSVGNLVLNRIERQTGPIIANASKRWRQAPSRLAARAVPRLQTMATRAQQRRRFPSLELEALDLSETEVPESDEIQNVEEPMEHAVFSENEEMELAAQLLEAADERELDRFIGALITRAEGDAPASAHSQQLRGLLRRAAKSALPVIGDAVQDRSAPGLGGSTGSRLASAAGKLFGLELEGLSPEDQEFEVARRFVRFAGAGVRNGRRLRSFPPQIAARRALSAAARRHAPGYLGRRKPRFPRRPGGIGVGPGSMDLVDSAPPPPIPIAITCHCAGPSQPVAPGDGNNASSVNPPPDNEPATSVDSQTQKPKENDMHDLDRTTMEINDETADLEFADPQGEYGGENSETTFSEEEEAELAAQLLEINDEAQLDQFIGGLLKKARRALGGLLKSPLLQPLGGFIKGAIKKALPIAGNALGNIVMPGAGGQIGSRLASSAGSLFGLELEGLAPEDQEFEVAKRVVRTIGSAVQNAAQSPAAATDPQAAAKTAVITAANAHLPGLLQGQAAGRSPGHRPRSGRWYRRHGKIVLVGI